MKIVVVIPSKSTDDPLTLEALDYLKRLRRPLSAQSMFLSPKSKIDEAHKEKRMDLEGKEILQKTEGFTRISLTEEGKTLSSTQFVSFLEKLMHRTSKTAFIVGGAFGLSEEVKKASDSSLSLSPMTMPHRLAFLVLCEQLYRASEIMQGSPYHK